MRNSHRRRSDIATILKIEFEEGSALRPERVWWRWKSDGKHDYATWHWFQQRFDPIDGGA